jgi:hypothetical protein
MLPPVPTHGEVCIGVPLDGAGTGTIGLTPLPPSSVAPSGIAPLESAEAGPERTPDDCIAPDAVPLVAAGEQPAIVPTPVTPIDDMPFMPDADIAPFAGIPPPSKLDVPPTLVSPGQEVVPRTGADGLSPPGTSSVEPSGIPVAPAEPVLKGEVIPIPGLVPGLGAVMLTCADTWLVPSRAPTNSTQTTESRRNGTAGLFTSQSMTNLI